MPRQGIAPAPQRIAASTCSPHGRGRHRLQASFRRVPGSHLPETGLQAIQLSPYRADPPAHRPVRLGTVTGFLACYFPHSPFGSRVSHQIQRHLLQSLPATRAIQQCASWRTQVAGLLGGPFPGGMRRDSEDPDAPAGVLGVTVPPGAVTGMVTRIAGAVKGCLEVIRRALAAAEVAQSGETGFRVAGRLAWVHSASSGRFALITVHPRRGRHGAARAWTPPGCSRTSPGSPCTTAGHPRTATARSRTPCATRMPCGNPRPSPTPPRPASGAGPPRPPTPCAT